MFGATASMDCPEMPLAPPTEGREAAVTRLLEEFQELEDEHASRLYRLLDLEDRMEEVAQELGDLDCTVTVRRVNSGD